MTLLQNLSSARNGDVHCELRNHGLAVQCYKDYLQRKRIQLGDDHKKVAGTLIAIGNINNDIMNLP